MLVDRDKTILGLKVWRSADSLKDYVLLDDLENWMSARDAACAEYLVDAIRQYKETGETVGDEQC